MSVLISIRPKWCELIASGAKTIEVRKSRPKCDPPFKCYIYCTKPKFPHDDFLVFDAGPNKVKAFYGGGMVIGEFVCDSITGFGVPYPAYQYQLDPDIKRRSCLTYTDLHNYAGHRNLLGWHISELKIYDNPKEISEFSAPCTRVYCQDTCPQWKHHHCDLLRDGVHPISRPPQSWCYVEEKS